ncbi:unnamed protein product [Anisakis simplex]|uniref:CUB domain-containing protein n=1 Tax=Anisakis simplex TaxID=6269 RepID=A0A0M3IYF9_ANISI|nr:unnamed protein product [Anisakis simplex]
MHPAGAVDLYRAGDELNANGLLRLILPDDKGVCSSSSTMPIKYAINTTTYCAWSIENSESCNRSLKMKNYFLDYITANAICDRSNDNCFTPILIDYNYNGTTNQLNDCQYLSDMLIDIITQNGVITGFKIRFDVSEGHLRCPSEVTCLNEFRYFLKVIDYGSSMAQFISLIPIMIIAVIFVSFKYMF